MTQQISSFVQQQEGLCPVCHQKMQFVSTNSYQCERCKQTYLEQAYCPICSHLLKIVKGCGSINYICMTDGLVSSSKVIFNYLATDSD